MTQDRNTIIAAALDKLFRTYERSDRNADPGDLARERMAKAKVYFEAVGPYEAQDVDRAVSDFLAGDVPAGWNLAYPPSAPQVGSAVRRAMERRLEAARLSRLALPPPADDWVDDAPEVKALNRAKLDAVVQSLANTMRTDDAEADRKAKALANRTNARFDPSTDPADMAARLGLKRARYTVGDPDAENGDMGGMPARASA